MARELMEISLIAVHGSEAYEKLRNEAVVTIQSDYPENCEPSAWATRLPYLPRQDRTE